MDLSHVLNEEQQQAVMAPDGPVLVIAAAGTGKTRVLTHRVAYLAQQGVDPRRVLLLTFTNKAAHEMVNRARELVGDAVSGMWGGTFHHMANRLLRRHAAALGYGVDYTILDQDDSRTLMKQCQQQVEVFGKHFPKPDVLLSLFGLAVSTGTDAKEILEQRFDHLDIDIDKMLEVHALYTTRKRDLNVMDFDDLLVNGLKLLEEHEDIQTYYQEKFQHVLVDEYQDTNMIQSSWVERLADLHRNLFVVGDDFQSIYSWRGADYKNILEFPQRYPNARTYKLVTNYRSVPEILDVANVSIAGNPQQFQKTLKAMRDTYKKPGLVRLQDGQAQARFIVQSCLELKAGGYRMQEICVLYRSHFQALELQLELARARLPYVITSGVRFFEQAHIKDVCALLRVLVNPGDELAFQRLCCLLPRVGQRTARKIWQQLGGRFQAAAQQDRQLLQSAVPKAAQVDVKIWIDLMERYVDEGYDRHPDRLLDAFYEDYYDRFAQETFDNYERRVEDIQELVRYVGQFESAEAFLSDVALLTNLDEDVGTVDAQGDGLRLSTIHQAKGLEWKVVFILWLADGMFPSGRSLSETADDSEERRLFYVAVTRAQDELFLCVPERRRARDGSLTFYSPSRFVKEVPDDHFHQLSPMMF